MAPSQAAPVLCQRSGNKQLPCTRTNDRTNLWRWAAAGAFVLLATAALYVAVLLYPAPLFAHHQRAGNFRIYSDRLPSVDVDALVAEATERLAAMELTGETQIYKVYLCHSLDRYRLFARLTRRSASSQALGLSLPGNVFVSMPRLAEFSTHQGELFIHSRFEGRPAFAIAHEIAHFHAIEKLGLKANRALPGWKIEGWADYQANLAAIDRDPNYDLGKRIDLAEDHGYWLDPSLRARRFYTWQVMVEYLARERGYRFDDLIQPAITEAETKAQMRAWRHENGPR